MRRVLSPHRTGVLAMEMHRHSIAAIPIFSKAREIILQVMVTMEFEKKLGTGDG